MYHQSSSFRMHDYVAVPELNVFNEDPSSAKANSCLSFRAIQVNTPGNTLVWFFMKIMRVLIADYQNFKPDDSEILPTDLT